MTDQAKRGLGIALIVLALILCGAAALLWQHADDDAQGNPYNAAFGLSDPPSADHTPSIMLLVGGGVAVVCGVILVSSSRPAEKDSSASSADPDAG